MKNEYAMEWSIHTYFYKFANIYLCFLKSSFPDVRWQLIKHNDVDKKSNEIPTPPLFPKIFQVDLIRISLQSVRPVSDVEL